MKWSRAWLVALSILVVQPAFCHPSDRDAARAPKVGAIETPSEPAKAPDQLVLDGRVVGERVPSREGEVCLLCNKPISKDDVTYLVEGQRVPVHRHGCLESLTANPGAWLARLRPAGAFLDAKAASLGLSGYWLWFGSYIFAGLIFGALAANRAFRVGRNPLAWSLIGFVASLPGYLVLLSVPKNKLRTPAQIPKGLAKIASTYAPIACPACGTENHPSAHKCSGCGGNLAPRIASEVERAGLHNR